MIFKKYLLSAVAITISVVAIAQNSVQTTVVEPIKNEKWWGLLSGMGSEMPFSKPIKIDLSQTSKSNQSASTLVSNSGRYIWSENPFTFEIDDLGAITITSQYEKIEPQKVGKTLREAYIALAQKHLIGNKTLFADAIFSMPIINISQSNTSSSVVELCKVLKNKNFKPNIFSFDNSWQRYNGSLEFNQSQYVAPKEMINEIHDLGGKVVLWISPFVSADSPIYRELSKRGFLLLDSKTLRPKLVEWGGGVSASYDFTNPAAVAYFVDKLSKLKTAYMVDGFSFAEGDVDFYTTNVKFFTESASAITHVKAWNAIASNFKMSQIKSTFNSQGLTLSHQLADNQCTWKSLKSLIPNLMAASLMGYPYISVGAKYIDESEDQTLAVRLTQLQAATPIMNLPESVISLSEENIVACQKATALHSKFSEYISELSKETIETGAPIIRTMEYEFPGKAFADCNDQFMLGSRYLIAPILTPDGKRIVRLPNGRWQDDLGNIYRGPRVLTITAPINRLPYFEYIKSESIINKVFNRR